MRKATLVCLLSSIVCVNFACSRSRVEPNDSLAFMIGSQTVASLPLGELKRRIEPRTVTVFEPYERATVAFEAIPLEAVLDEAYGPSWRDHEALLFTCRDGYQPTIPVKRVLKHEAFVAFARPGDDGFTVLKDEEGTKRRVPLEPAYVIWKNLDDARILSEGDYGWPYQVTQIELVTFRSRFAEMAPPEDASAKARAGFEVFTAHCSKCHAVNGHGGTVGPELNYPASPTEYMKADWLRRWIDDPTSMRQAPRMPPLNRQLPHRAELIEEIVAYLEEMATHKSEPRRP